MGNIYISEFDKDNNIQNSLQFETEEEANTYIEKKINQKKEEMSELNWKTGKTKLNDKDSLFTNRAAQEIQFKKTHTANSTVKTSMKIELTDDHDTDYLDGTDYEDEEPQHRKPKSNTELLFNMTLLPLSLGVLSLFMAATSVIFYEKSQVIPDIIMTSNGQTFNHGLSEQNFQLNPHAEMYQDIVNSMNEYEKDQKNYAPALIISNNKPLPYSEQFTEAYLKGYLQAVNQKVITQIKQQQEEIKQNKEK